MSTRVVFFINSMAGGGAERVVLNLISGLTAENYLPELALLQMEGEYLHAIPSSVPIHNFSTYRGIVNLLPRIVALSRFIRKQQPDIIISGLETPNTSLMRSALVTRAKTRYVLTQHNHLSLTLARSPRTDNIFKRREVAYLYQRADCIIAVSHGVKQDLMDNFGVSDSKIEVIPNPIDINLIQKAASQPVTLPWLDMNGFKLIVAAGRLVESKGYTDLVYAFDRVRKQLPARLLILGEGPLRPVLQKQIDELGLSDDIHLMGFVDNPWMYMKRADIHISSSHSEGFSLNIVEAMACRTPVVATDCDFGPREIITPNVNGILTPVGDTAALSEAILNVAGSQDLSAKLTAAGLQRAAQFDLPVIVRRYEDLICQLINPK